MGLTVRLTPRAIADLNEIRAYLRDRNPRGAERVRQRIQQSVAMLANFPGIGRPTHLARVSVATVPRYPYSSITPSPAANSASSTFATQPGTSPVAQTCNRCFTTASASAHPLSISKRGYP